MIDITKEQLEERLQKSHGDILGDIKVTDFSSVSPDEVLIKICVTPIKVVESIDCTIVVEKTNEEALGYQKEIRQLEKRMNKYVSPINEKINQLNKMIEETCVHNDTKVVYEYESGSYYDQCRYITKVVCNVCGRALKRDVKYGGFN